MIKDLGKQITYITVNDETYIYDKTNMIFTFRCINYLVMVVQLETVEDFTELYKETISSFKGDIPKELITWFNNCR